MIYFREGQIHQGFTEFFHYHSAVIELDAAYFSPIVTAA